MSTHFNYYLIHPSIVLIRQQNPMLMIETILKQNHSSGIIVYDTSSLLGNQLIKTQYQNFLTQIAQYADQFPNRIFQLHQESMYMCARKLIEKKRSICFIAFPFQELRSLHSLITSVPESVPYRAIVFPDQHSPEKIDLRTGDGSFAEIFENKDTGYEPLQDIASVPVCQTLSNIRPLKGANTPSSFIYLYEDKKDSLIFKSVFRPPVKEDYFLKIKHLISIRTLFTNSHTLEALPQKIISDGDKRYGFAATHIEGPTLEQLYHNNKFTSFMEEHHYKCSLANRIYILIQLCSTICQYNSVGIFLSDIKANNFIVTSTCEIVPIDSDGFSYLKYSSSPPRPEMARNRKLPGKTDYFQTIDCEIYSTTVLIYYFLMYGRSPFRHPRKKSAQTTLEDLYLKKPDLNPHVLEVWNAYPEYLQKALYESLVEGKTYSIESFLILLIRFYLQLTNAETKIINCSNPTDSECCLRDILCSNPTFKKFTRSGLWCDLEQFNQYIFIEKTPVNTPKQNTQTVTTHSAQPAVTKSAEKPVSHSSPPATVQPKQTARKNKNTSSFFRNIFMIVFCSLILAGLYFHPEESALLFYEIQEWLFDAISSASDVFADFQLILSDLFADFESTFFNH